MKHLLLAIVVLSATGAASAAEVCTAVADAATGTFLVQRGDCARRVTPASTFKIPLSMMGYDSGFLRDAQQPLLPFRPGYVDWRPSWKQPTDPTRWMSESVVWYSQQITLSLGKQRFADYVRQFKYGNEDVSGDAKRDGLTLSWINSSLRISPLEQISFLTSFVNRRLGVTPHAYAMTEKLTEHGTLPGGWKLHGKTGWASSVGWYVGWASKGTRTVVFARLVEDDATRPQDVPPGAWARDGFLADFAALVGTSQR